MHLRHSTLARAALAALLLGASACQAVPPPARFAGPAGVVRAGTGEEAEEVARMLAGLEPHVAALLPGLRERRIEVWVQPSPHLYAFSSSAYEEADGFWSQSAGRIHLRQSAESLERTLAHELVHSLLDASWERLPGTIEEGLCDWVSAELCPADAPYMRAGRLSAAAFALGGLELELALLLPREEAALGIEVGYAARVLLHGELGASIDPLSVFRVRAGLSTTRMEAGAKKALYGLAYLVVDRIAERHGIAHLHELCLRAERERLPEVPMAWLLEAAELPADDPSGWARHLRERFGDEELAQLLRMYPTLLLDTLDKSFGARALFAARVPQAPPALIRIGLRHAPARVALPLASD